MRAVFIYLLMVASLNSWSKWEFKDEFEALDAFYAMAGDKKFDPDLKLLQKYLDTNTAERPGGLNVDFKSEIADYESRLPHLERAPTMLTYSLMMPMTEERSKFIELLVANGASLDRLLDGQIKRVDHGRKWAFSNTSLCDTLMEWTQGLESSIWRSPSLNRKLLTHSGGMSPNYHCRGAFTHGFNPLFSFAGNFENAREIYSIYLQILGLDPNGVSDYGKTPIFNFVGGEALGVVQALLDAGADVNFRKIDPNRVETPIIHATSLSSEQAIQTFETLVSAGADLHLPWSSAHDSCALFYDIISGYQRSIEWGKVVISRTFTALKKRGYRFKECDDRTPMDYSRHYNSL